MSSSGHSHDHLHSPDAPHPAQPASWSLLRMALPARLGVAGLIAAGLWTLVLAAMR